MHQVLTFKENVPALNSTGSGGKRLPGLLRMHWSERKRQVDKFCWLIKAQKPRTFSGKVHIHYHRYGKQLMDWDNFCASFKIIGDALSKCGVIVDDSPKYVERFVPSQSKLKGGKEAITYVEIIDAE